MKIGINYFQKNIFISSNKVNSLIQIPSKQQDTISNSNNISLNSHHHFPTYSPKSPEKISKLSLSERKSIFSINLREIYDFSIDSLKEFQKRIEEIKKVDGKDLEQKIKDIKTLVIERVLWNKKVNAQANISNIDLIKNLNKSKDYLSDISMSYYHNISLNINIKYNEINIINGNFRQNRFHFELELEFSKQVDTNYGWKDIEGNELKFINKNTIETGRYILFFQSETSFIIHDSLTNLYTRIWGDPHVDLSDKEGEFNGEFSDLKKSFFRTTLILLDGTRVTFNAPDNGVIETVEVFKGNSKAFGLGTPMSKEQKANLAKLSGIFYLIEDSEDVVYAGGDGNDWYDSKGNLIWGG